MRSPFALIHHYDASDPADLILSGMAGTKAEQDAYEEAVKLATYWSANQDLRHALDAGLTPVSSPLTPRPSTRTDPQPSKPSAPRRDSPALND
ncbi:hypothetical protein EV646_107289 [Kribbella antiqua]|uniref:Uncharacterized protein n=1 Tax=Kribbella antiqua TaxID=2512217 RepID=A0A4R2ITU0_9ACTN|nr:hypothetical protein [Kribbella antiqua]TCO46265.1 hypothetical protein EV646_107289 [Kribbella antiqua]